MGSTAKVGKKARRKRKVSSHQCGIASEGQKKDRDSRVLTRKNGEGGFLSRLSNDIARLGCSDTAVRD